MCISNLVFQRSPFRLGPEVTCGGVTEKSDDWDDIRKRQYLVSVPLLVYDSGPSGGLFGRLKPTRTLGGGLGTGKLCVSNGKDIKTKGKTCTLTYFKTVPTILSLSLEGLRVCTSSSPLSNPTGVVDVSLFLYLRVFPLTESSPA